MNGTTGRPDHLVSWWAERSHRMALSCAAKRDEYGTADLVGVGKRTASMGSDGHTRSDSELAEIGILFYLGGKVDRAVEAVCHGRQPSLDTWNDIATYALMVLAIREGGPGVWPL